VAEHLLPYGAGTVRVRIPDGVATRVVEPPRPATTEPAAAVVARALDAPAGARPLEEAARGARRVLVVLPDRTRDAAVSTWLGEVLARLARAGVPKEGVRALFGGGIHAPVGAADAEAVLGASLARGLAWCSTSPDDPAAHADLGIVRGIAPCRVHRAVLEADLVVLCGGVAPHYLAGFSGGPKALVPGCADRETVAAAHRLTLDATVAPDGSVRSWLGRVEGNPFRAALLAAARLLPNAFLVNVGLAGGRVLHAAAGGVEEAHARACADHRALLAAPAPEPADLVVAGGGAPGDRDLLQAHKALVSAVAWAKPGAPVVWLAEAANGAGHDAFLPWFEAGKPERHLAALRRSFHPYGLTAYALRWKAARHPVHVVSALSRDVLRPMGLLPFSTAQDAVDHAVASSRPATCVVLPRAAATFS
jgi:nickel-dependent lactate racemase